MGVTKGVGQRLLMFLSVREQTGMHYLEIILRQVYQSAKVVSFWGFFSSTDPVSVTGAWAWCGGNWSESGMFIWGLALEVEAPG